MARMLRGGPNGRRSGIACEQGLRDFRRPSGAERATIEQQTSTLLLSSPRWDRALGAVGSLARSLALAACALCPGKG